MSFTQVTGMQKHASRRMGIERSRRRKRSHPLHRMKVDCCSGLWHVISINGISSMSVGGLEQEGD